MLELEYKNVFHFLYEKTHYFRSTGKTIIPLYDQGLNPAIRPENKNFYVTLFIYSYIKDLGGSPITYLAILIVNFVSNFIALIASPWLIKRYGHENLIASGLFINGITFVTYSVIENPMMMMLVEPFDGICSSLS